jgi:hypothetical protein
MQRAKRQGAINRELLGRVRAAVLADPLILDMDDF